MNGTPFPHVDEAFLVALEKRFPDRLPRRPVKTDDIHALIGQQEVIHFLRFQFDEQNNPPPED